MNESFSDMLAVGGKKNSLGLVNGVVSLVLEDRSRLEELYENIAHEDAWVRMRAVDAFEKVCREHPEWITQYIDRIQTTLALSAQASIQWHIAQIYEQVDLDNTQKVKAIDWLETLLKNKETDWIVSTNCMETLASFVRSGDVNKPDLITLLKIQLSHKSNAVKKRAQKLLLEFS